MSFCGFCKDSKEQLKSCVCKKVSYCGKECQTKDWKSHKPSCPLCIIRESPGKGRGLFATRKINEGQVIFYHSTTISQSQMNHSCVSNTTLNYVNGDTTRKEFRATMVIEKDEEIVINYVVPIKAEFNYGSRELRRQELLETVMGVPGFLCSCSECSLEGKALEENERMRAEIREKSAEIRELLSCQGSLSRRSTEKLMSLALEKLDLVEKLNIRLMFVTEMVNVYVAASRAQKMGITAPDPNIFRQKALDYAKKCGECSLNYCNLQLAYYEKGK